MSIEPPSQDQPTLKRRIPVPFFLNLTAGQMAALASDRITFPYRIVKVQAHFRDDAANNLQVWAFVSRNNNVAGAAPPPDNKILGFYSPTPYLIGEGEIVSVDCDVVPDPAEQFLKVYFCNFNAYAMSGYCIITIETQAGVDQIISIGTGQDERTYTTDDFRKILKNRSSATVAETIDATGGSPGWVEDLIANQNLVKGETLEAFRLQAEAIATVQNYFKPASTLEGFEQELMFWFTKGWQLADKYTISRQVGAVSTLLGGVNIAEYKLKEEEEIWGFTKEMGEVNAIIYDISINERVRQRTNIYYPFKLPNAVDLINMVVKEKIPLQEFIDNMLKQGFDPYWSNKLWDAHFYAPDFETIKRAIWRGTIGHDEIVDMLKRVDLDPFYNDKVWFSQLYEIPPYADLINMRVKEVINQETFAKSIQAHGFYDPWATRLWDAHFTPADFTDFLTAMRRKLSVNIPVAEGPSVSHTFGLDSAKDIEVVKALSVLADYDPRYWDFFQTRIYNDPSYRMIMWGFEAGAIKPEEVPDLVHRLGLNPKDESWYQQFLMRFQERAWITRYLTALATAYINDAITADDLKTRVKAIPRNEEIANWMIKIADVRKEIIAKKGGVETAKLVTVSELKDAYTLGLMNEDNLRTELMGRGFTLLDVDLLINLINKKFEIEEAGGKKEGLTVAELFDAFRYSEISEDTLRMELMTKGLSLEQANILISTKKKKWEIGQVEGGD